MPTWFGANAAPRRQQDEENREIAENAHAQERDLDGSMREFLLAEHPPDCSDVEAYAFEQHQGKEVVTLSADQFGSQAGFGRGGFAREVYCAASDVWVLALPIGIGVVPVVLAHPPAVAETSAQTRQYSADPLVPSRRSENLAVTRFVAQEAELGEDQTERGCQQELEPG